MADNTTVDNGALPDIEVATDKVTYSGDADRDVQLIRMVQVEGAEGAKTVVDLPGDAAYGLDVDVTRLPALPAGTNNIGDVDVLSMPPLPAGTANIGDVDVLTLPPIPAGTNNIGDVDVLTLPSIPAGNNNIGDVDVASLPSLPAGNANIGDVDVVTLPALPAGNNNIGDVDVASSALPTGAATSANQTTQTTALQLIDDPVKVLGTDTYAEATDKGFAVGAVRRDADTTLVNTTNEWGPLQMDANGRLKVEAFSGETLPVSLATLPALVAGTANIGDVDVLTVPADPFGVNADAASATGSISAKLRFIAATGIPITALPALVAGTANIGDVDIVGGTIASDSPLTTNPQTIGGRASTAVPTAVSADGDVVDARFLRNGAQVVHVVDSAGAAQTFGGGTQYAGDAPATSTPTGTMEMGLAKATVPSDVTADNDAVAAWYLRNGIQNVRLVDGAGSALSVGGGTQHTEDVAIAANAGVGNLMIARRDDALSALTPVEDDAVGLRVNSQGALWVAQGAALPAGTNNIGDVDIVTLPALVAGTANIGDVDVLTVPADPFGVNADAASATGSMSAKLRFIAATGIPVTALPALVAGTANIGDVDVLTVPADPFGANADAVVAAGATGSISAKLRRATQGLEDLKTSIVLAASTGTQEVVGDIAHDTGVSGNPVQVAGAAQDMDDTAPPNRVSAESDVTRTATDRDGTQFVHPHGPQVWSYHSDGSSALTDASVHSAPGAGLSLYVTDIVVSTGAATALNVFFEEGSTKVLGPYYLEAVAGRGLAIHFLVPKKITANTALTVTTSAAIAQAVDVTGFTAQG